VAQGIGPEFKPQYCKKKERKKQTNKQTWESSFIIPGGEDLASDDTKLEVIKENTNKLNNIKEKPIELTPP
jgi:hypothetical protein